MISTLFYFVLSFALFLPSISMAMPDPILNSTTHTRAAKAPHPQADKKKAPAIAKADADAREKAAADIKDKNDAEEGEQRNTHLEEIREKIALSDYLNLRTSTLTEIDLNKAQFGPQKNQTALNAVVANGPSQDLEDLIKFLVSKGADPLIIDQKGDQTIHNAARLGNLVALQVFHNLKGMTKIDMTAQNSSFKTILDIAREELNKNNTESRFLGIVQYIEELPNFRTHKYTSAEISEEKKLDGDRFINRIKNTLLSLQQIKNIKISSLKEIVIDILDTGLGAYTRALYKIVIGGKKFFMKLLTATRCDYKNADTERNNLRNLETQLTDYDDECTKNPLLPKLGRYVTDTKFFIDGQPFQFILLENRDGIPLWNLINNVFQKLAPDKTLSQKELGWFTKIGKSLASFHLKYKTSTSTRLETLIHGDLHFGNILFDQDKEEVALIDYETMTTGDAYKDTRKLFRHDHEEALRFILKVVAPRGVAKEHIIEQFHECFNQIARGYNEILAQFGLSEFNIALPYPEPITPDEP